jgi:GNAT superfamily N-acetyltransferase
MSEVIAKDLVSASEWTLQRAELGMAADIRAMQARSMRALGRGFYAPQVIERFLEDVGTLDEAVVAEGHYFLVRDAGGAVIGSGGWSRRRPAYGSGGAAEAARPVVRGVFVDPGHIRRGIATALMRHVEADASAHGCATLHLCATLSGVGFYGALGYRRLGPRTLRLADGTGFACVDMQAALRRLGAAA